MKTGIKLVTFFKKHGYWLVLVAAFALLVTIIALSVNAGNVALEDEQTQPAEQTSVKEVTFAMPITSATVAKEYSNSALQYNKTLNLWQSHKAIDFLAEEGTDVFAVLDGTIKEVTYSYLMGNILKLDVGNGMIVVYASLQNDIPVKASQLAAGVKGRVSVAFSLYNKIAPGKIIARGTIVNFDNSETASAISYGAELMRWCGMPLDVIATNYLVGQCDGVVMFAHREVTSREKHYLPADIDKWGIVIYHNLVLRLVVYDNETIRRNRRKVAFEILKMFCPNVDAGCSVATDIKNNVFAQRIPRNNVGIVNSF